MVLITGESDVGEDMVAAIDPQPVCAQGGTVAAPL
jgi:hypothetical protein